MSLSALLFDKDGTLVDFDATWGPATYRTMRDLTAGDQATLAKLAEISHFRLDLMRFEPTSPLLAGNTEEYGPLWADALGRNPDAAFYTEMDMLLRDHGLASLTPIGDPAGVLARLAARGLRLGIATNDSESSARAQASALRLDAICPFVVGYDSGHGAKPGPGMIEAFVRETGVPPAHVGMVGDTLHDLHAARAAGVVAIAVLTGPRGEAARADLAPHADHVVGSIADLEALVDTLSAKAAPSLRPSA